MIKTELLKNGTLIKHYSDAGFMLLQVETGMKYSDPVDVFPCRYTYEETDELIDADDAGDGIHITGEEFLAKLEEVL